MRIGCGVGGAELEMELPRLRDFVAPCDRTDAHGGLAVAIAKIVEGGAPTMWRQAGIRDRAWRGDRCESADIFENASDEGARRGRELTRARSVISRWRAIGLLQAHMHMDAVADALGRDDRGETDRFAAGGRGGMGEFAQDDRLVGGDDAFSGIDRDLILPLAIFAQETVGGQPRLTQRPHQCLAEKLAALEAAQRIGATGVRVALEREFMFERTADSQSGPRLKIRDG